MVEVLLRSLYGATAVMAVHHQLGKSMMERMGGMEQKPCVRFIMSAGQV